MEEEKTSIDTGVLHVDGDTHRGEENPATSDVDGDTHRDEEDPATSENSCLGDDYQRDTSTHPSRTNVQERTQTSNPRRILQRWLYSPMKIKKVNGNFQCSVQCVFLIFMCMQITKTVFISIQLNQFGEHRRYFQDLVENGYTTIEHLLLKDWSPDLETPPYPQSRGPYAIYTRQHLIEHINYAVENYCHFDSKVIGVYTVVSCLNKTDFVRICITFVEFDSVTPDNGNSQKQPNKTDKCFGANMNSTSSYDIEEDMRRNNINEEAAFIRFLSINISFEMNSSRLAKDHNSGQCLHINGIISYTDEENSGQALVDLATHTSQIKCRLIGIDLKVPASVSIVLYLNRRIVTGDVCLLEDIHGLTITVLVLSFVSVVLICLEGGGMILCRKKIGNLEEDIVCLNNMECGVCVQLPGECLIIASSQREKEMTHTDNDTNISVGKIIKAKWGLFVQLTGDIIIITDCVKTLSLYDTEECNLEDKEDGEQRLEDLDLHAILLGIGCFICWMALTRYLNCYRGFSLLFKTIRSALPTVASYVFSACICFFGFVLCGYVVFGPYHNKFQTLPLTANTLLSIISGDEIFATAVNFDKAKAGKESLMLWLYTVYIWLYVFIFTVIAFNIMIAIFNNAYDAIQKAYDEKHQDDPKPNMNGSDVSENNLLESLKEKRRKLKCFDCLFSCNCKKEAKRCICHCKTQPIRCNCHCTKSGYNSII